VPSVADSVPITPHPHVRSRNARRVSAKALRAAERLIKEASEAALIASAQAIPCEQPYHHRSSRYHGTKHVPVSDRAFAFAALNMTEDGRQLNLRLGLAGPDSAHWQKAGDEEISRLIDTGTLHACYSHDQPAERRKDTTYYNPQTKEKCDEHTNQKIYRVRGAAGGGRINYPGDVSARCADMELVKILINLTISEPDISG